MNWTSNNDIPLHLRPAIPIDPNVGKFETHYRLPSLKGTPRQIDWGRNLRHRWLGNLLNRFLDALQPVSVEDRHQYHVEADRIRSETLASFYIDVRLDDPIAYFLAAPERAAEAERKERREASAKVRQINNRRDSIAAKKWEIANGIAPIVGESDRQATYARIMRFRATRETPDVARMTSCDAGFWIAHHADQDSDETASPAKED